MHQQVIKCLQITNTYSYDCLHTRQASDVHTFTLALIQCLHFVSLLLLCHVQFYYAGKKSRMQRYGLINMQTEDK